MVSNINNGRCHSSAREWLVVKLLQKSFTAVRLDDWCRSVDEEGDEEWLIDKILPYDAAVLLSGPPKLGFKTWFAFLVALLCASGRKLGFLCPNAIVPVLIIELEGSRKQTRNRFTFLCNALGMQLDALPIYFSHRNGELIDDQEWTNQIVKFVKEKEIGLVILDTLAKATTGNENDNQAIGTAMRNIDRVRQAHNGCSFVFLHHLRKPSKDYDADIDHEIRGASAISGYYDMHWAMRRRRANQSHVDMFIRSSDDEDRHFGLKWVISKEEASAALQMERIEDDELPENWANERVNEMIPDFGYTDKRLAEALEMTVERALSTARELETAGRLRHEKGKWWRV